ncbi:MAG: hypothetical protein QM704_00550 [Anaeromyxobacteraceae bacterium]
MFADLWLELSQLEREHRRLAIRSTAATVVAIALALTGVIASAWVVGGDESVVLEALATAPLPASIATGARAVGLRRRMRELRLREATVRAALADRSERIHLRRTFASAS